MNEKLFLLMLISTVSFIECDKLSKEENENRLETCGQKMQNKIYHGEKNKIFPEDSPWTVYVETETRGGNRSACSGTVISSRHVLTATHCFASLPEDMNRFLKIMMNDKPIEKKDCTGSDYIIDDLDVARKVSIGTGKSIQQGKTQPYLVKKIWLISACRKFESQGSLVDLTLLEMENDFPLNSRLRPACVSESMSDVAGGVTMDFYGYGTQPAFNEPESSSSLAEFQYEQTWVIQPQFVFRSKTPKSGKYSEEQLILARSTSEKSVACAGDSGGGATRVINGRTTLVGVISQTSCRGMLREAAAIELYVAVASKSEKWCEYGGICSGSWRINQVLVGIIVFISYLINE